MITVHYYGLETYSSDAGESKILDTGLIDKRHGKVRNQGQKALMLQIPQQLIIVMGNNIIMLRMRRNIRNLEALLLAQVLRWEEKGC